MGAAFSDVLEKTSIIRERSKLYNEPLFFTLVQKEIALGVHQCNGENNKSVLTKELYKKYKEYISGSRSMLRMMWFMNYLIIMFTEIYSKKTAKISDCSSKAYDEALSPNHTFFVRTAARVAMGFCPDRKDLIYLVVEKDKDEVFAY